MNRFLIRYPRAISLQLRISMGYQEEFSNLATNRHD